MTVIPDILYVNIDILKIWLAHVGNTGWPASISQELKEKRSFGVELAKKLFGLHAKLGGKVERETSIVTEYLPEAIRFATQLIQEASLYDLVASYQTAVKKESEGQSLRYVFIKGYISWLPQVEGYDWCADIVIENCNDDKGRPSQHILQLSHANNAALSPIGAHCRRVEALTFWRDKFTPSTFNELTKGSAIMIWDRQG